MPRTEDDFSFVQLFYFGVDYEEEALQSRLD